MFTGIFGIPQIEIAAVCAMLLFYYVHCTLYMHISSVFPQA